MGRAFVFAVIALFLSPTVFAELCADLEARFEENWKAPVRFIKARKVTDVLLVPSQQKGPRKPRVWATGGNSDSGRVVSVASGDQLAALPSHRPDDFLTAVHRLNSTASFAATKDRSLVISVPPAGSSTAYLMWAPGPEVLAAMEVPGPVKKLQFVRRDTVVASTSHSLALWSTRSKRDPKLRVVDFWESSNPEQEQHVVDFAPAPGGREIAIVFSSGRIGIYSVAELMKATQADPVLPRAVTNVADAISVVYSQDGKHLIVRSDKEGPSRKGELNGYKSVQMARLAAEDLRIENAKKLGDFTQSTSAETNTLQVGQNGLIVVGVGGPQSTVYLLGSELSVRNKLETDEISSVVVTQNGPSLLFVGTQSGRLIAMGTKYFEKTEFYPSAVRENVGLGSVDVLDVSPDGKWLAVGKEKSGTDGDASAGIYVYSTDGFLDPNAYKLWRK